MSDPNPETDEHHSFEPSGDNGAALPCRDDGAASILDATWLLAAQRPVPVPTQPSSPRLPSMACCMCVTLEWQPPKLSRGHREAAQIPPLAMRAAAKASVAEPSPSAYRR